MASQALPPVVGAAAAAPTGNNSLEKCLQLEKECCETSDHLAMLAESACAPNLVWREMVCKWAYDVVDTVGEARSVVYVAMNILDRFCAVVAVEQARAQPQPQQKQQQLDDAAEVPAAMNERRYECASMTALFLAARVAGGSSDLQMTDLIHMSRGSVQLHDIVAMGKEMLLVLTWGPRVVTPVDFLQAMLPFLPSSSMNRALFESASFLVEISVCDVYLSRFPPSQVAYAAILNEAKNLMTRSEMERFFQNLQGRSPSLEASSLDTRTVRARLESVYGRIYENPQDANGIDNDDNNDNPNHNNANMPHYISDDEDDDEDAGDDIVPPMATTTTTRRQPVVKATFSYPAHLSSVGDTTTSNSRTTTSTVTATTESESSIETYSEVESRLEHQQANAWVRSKTTISHHHYRPTKRAKR